MFLSLAIEFPDPLPTPVTLTVVGKPLAAPGSTMAIGTGEAQSVTCPD